MKRNIQRIFILSLLCLPLTGAFAASGRKLVKDANKLYQSDDSAKVAEALEKYMQARESRKDRFEIPFNIGKTYSKLGHETEAQTWLEEAARSTDKKVKADANYQLGNNQFRKKKWDEAIRYYTDALRSNPSD
ncbi:MAG: tetratricopeptide repeat protein [bacterium]|nr:tetratricopeptide repeat protein [bacterium]